MYKSLLYQAERRQLTEDQLEELKQLEIPDSFKQSLYWHLVARDNNPYSIRFDASRTVYDMIDTLNRYYEHLESSTYPLVSTYAQYMDKIVHKAICNYKTGKWMVD